MKLITILLGIATTTATPTLAGSYGGHEHDYPYCTALFPEEPCFRDAEWCYSNWRSVNGWPKRHIESELSQNVTVTEEVHFDLNRIRECESLADNDPRTYQQCLALREDPGAFADKTLGLSSPSSPSANTTVDQLTTRSPRGSCCRFTTHCHAYLRSLDSLASYNAFETWKHTGYWTKSACCRMLWYRSCDGDHKPFPSVIEEPPRCSVPVRDGIEMDP